MSSYFFAPMPAMGLGDNSFVTWINGFTSEEIDKIINYGDSLIKEKASIGGFNIDDDYSKYRESQVSWIECNSETVWLYERLAFILRQLNAQFFRYDVTGFNEHFQYTVYNGNENGHYSWHVDEANGKNFDSGPRKLSMVLQLSDPSEYEGGNLELMRSDTIETVERSKGLVAVFPSFRLHRVTPVTSGVRKTLVVWSTGPAFR
jgi:PKHD-type hydroxylase